MSAFLILKEDEYVVFLFDLGDKTVSSIVLNSEEKRKFSELEEFTEDRFACVLNESGEIKEVSLESLDKSNLLYLSKDWEDSLEVLQTLHSVSWAPMHLMYIVRHKPGSKMLEVIRQMSYKPYTLDEPVLFSPKPDKGKGWLYVLNRTPIPAGFVVPDETKPSCLYFSDFGAWFGYPAQKVSGT